MIRNRPPSPTSSNEQHEAPAGGRIKRSRAVLVCNRCKSLKTKCDLEKPCGSCVKAKVGERCVYEPWRGRGSQHQVRPPSQDPSNTTEIPISGPGPTTTQNRFATIESRLSNIEALLAGRASTHDHNTAALPRSDVRVSDDTEWQCLLDQLPPKDTAHRLLERYFLADTLQRYSHPPSMLRRFRDIYPLSASSVSIENAPFFACITMAMIIGGHMEQKIERESTGSVTPTSDSLMALYNRFLALSEKQVLDLSDRSRKPEGQYYHVLAGMLNVQRGMADHSSSLSALWCELGKIYHTAMVLGFHHDPTELPVVPTPFWSELRRRTWWQLKVGQNIITQKLRLPTVLPQSTVRKPVLIPDEALRGDITQDQLDSQTILTCVPVSVADLTPPDYHYGGPAAHAVPEWSFIETKIATTELFHEIHKLRPSRSEPVCFEDFEKLTKMVDEFDHQTPSHFRFETLSSVQSRQAALAGPTNPPWLLVQACVHNSGMTSAIMSTYQPYLSLPLSNSTQAEIVGIAFERSLRAAHRLIVSAEIFVWHITIRWPDGKALFSWNMGSKIFQAGITLALAAIRHGPSSPEWAGWMDDLTSAIGLMHVLADHAARSRTTSAGKGDMSDSTKEKTADEKGLNILRRLSEKARSAFGHVGSTGIPLAITTANVVPPEFSDPYTGDPVATMVRESRPPSPITAPPNQLSPKNPPPPPVPTPSPRGGSIPSYSQPDPVMQDFGIDENFSLEYLETLLKEVYGTPPGV